MRLIQLGRLLIVFLGTRNTNADSIKPVFTISLLAYQVYSVLAHALCLNQLQRYLIGAEKTYLAFKLY